MVKTEENMRQNEENRKLAYMALEQLKKSIQELYKTEKNYFTPVEGRERSIVFRIAHILANKIELDKNLNTNDVFVDIEANRCNGDIKRINLLHVIRPDLSVHKREGTGYLVVEFKCGNESEKDDYVKLRALTKEKDEFYSDYSPTYKLGAFIRLKNSGVEYTLFKDGEIVRPEKQKFFR